VQRHGNDRQQVGIDLLLAASDAFKGLAEELAAHDQWENVDVDPATLEWAQRLAAQAAWWCGRLEGEADAVLASDEVTRPSERGVRQRRCRR
jgi:hypothetical protein